MAKPFSQIDSGQTTDAVSLKRVILFENRCQRSVVIVLPFNVQGIGWIKRLDVLGLLLKSQKKFIVTMTKYPLC